MAPRADLRQLLLVPSFYGATLWLLLMPALAAEPLGIRLGATGWLMMGYVVACFAASCLLTLRTLGPRVARPPPADTGVGERGLFVAVTLLGFAGGALYVHDFATRLGGLGPFFYAFLVEPLTIRELATETTSLGFQVSYLGWLSLFYAGYVALNPRLGAGLRVGCAGVAALNFFVNLLFIDRTRPITLAACLIFLYYWLHFRRLRHVGLFFALAGLTPVVIFFLQVLFSGKFDAETGVVQNFSSYVLGGPAYMDDLLKTGRPLGDGSLVRTFAPASKILAALGLIDTPPPDILAFRSVPFTTNVGTFLEPLFSDLGFVGLLLGGPLVIHATDRLAAFALTSGSVAGIFLWANLIVADALSFFGPKFNATYVYLFAGLFGLTLLRRPARPRP